MSLSLILNGKPQVFGDLEPGCNLNALLEVLSLKADRIAIEVNGQIAPRTEWQTLQLVELDKLELVHFVGGGS